MTAPTTQTSQLTGSDDPFDGVTALDVEEETQRAVAAAFRRFTSERQAQRTDPWALTWSNVGACLKQAVYRLAGVDPSDPDLALEGENRAANCGAMEHDGLLPHLAAELDGQAEVPTVVTALDPATGREDRIHGTADIVSAARRGVWDLKTVREYGLEWALTGGARPSNRIQGGGYALGFHQAGVRIDWVTYLYMDRATGKAHPVTEPFGHRLVTDVVARVWLIQSYRSRPDLAPRTERGPGLSVVCDGCGWLQLCWGRGARPGVAGPQRYFGRDIGAIEAALTQYAKTREKIRVLEQEKGFWEAVFTHGSKPGVYGSYRWRRGAGSEVTDADAAAARLEELGETVPKKARRGALSVRPAD